MKNSENPEEEIKNNPRFDRNMAIRFFAIQTEHGVNQTCKNFSKGFF